jgi:BatD DUF11 like domain
MNAIGQKCAVLAVVTGTWWTSVCQGQVTNGDQAAYVAHIDQPTETLFLGKTFPVVIVIEEKISAILPNQDAFVQLPTHAPVGRLRDILPPSAKWQQVVWLKPVKEGNQQLGPFRIDFRGQNLTTDVITVDVLSTNVLDEIRVTLSADKTTVHEGEEFMLILGANKFYSGLEPNLLLPAGLVATGYVMVSSHADFTNGVLASKQTRRFKVKAFKAGVYTLGKSIVMIGGKHYDAEPLKMTVEP